MSVQKMRQLHERMIGKSQTKQLPNLYSPEDLSTGPDHIDFIGNGSFAKVRRCCHKQLGTIVMKYFVLTGSQETIDQKLEDAAKEAITLVNIDHRNIVRVLGVTSWNNNCGIIMEEVNGGSLEDLLYKKSSDPLPWQLRLRFFIEIADALKYLHNQKPPFVHGDLKPQNVLLMSDYTIKLADFGSVAIFQASQMVSSFQIPSNKQYTPLYCAPELLKDINNRRPSSDIYSYAMVGYEIICRSRVFVAPGVSHNLMIYYIKHNGQKPNMEYVDSVEKCLEPQSEDRDIFFKLKNVTIDCWNDNPGDRPSASHLCDQLVPLISSLKYEDESLTMSLFNNPSQKGPCVCSEDNETLMHKSLIEYLSSHLEIRFKVVNNFDFNNCLQEVSLKNNGHQRIPPKNNYNWSIYFNHYSIFYGKTLRKEWKTKHFDLDCVTDNLFKLTPNSCFKGLKPDEMTKVRLYSSILVGRCFVYPRWYVCIPNEEPRTVKCTDDENLGFVSPFESPKQYLRSSFDTVVPFSPSRRYHENKVKDFGYAPLRVVPKPLLFDINQHKSLKLSCSKCMCTSSLFESESLRLKTILGLSPGKTTILSKDFGTIDFEQRPVTNIRQTNEAYQISINANDNSITISSPTRHGAFYATQTLGALAEPSTGTDLLKFPSGVIKDAPRYDYRGLHIDVASNFVDTNDLLLIIKVMSMYKLNKLVLQLSNNNGWRIEIDGLPELTEVGSVRRHTEKRDAIPPAYGSGPDDTTSGSGYYSSDDYKKILKVASDHCIEIIPMIYIPGQCNAAIMSMNIRYDKFKDEDSNKAKEFILADINQTSNSRSLDKDEVINPQMDSSYTFIDHIIGTLKSMHEKIQPLQIWYIGGYGLFNKVWANPELFQEFKINKPIPSQIQSFHQYFLHKVTQLCCIKHGIKLGIHANVALQRPDEEVSLFQESIFSKESVVVFANNTFHEKLCLERGYKLANAGYKVVLSHASYLFLDHAQEPDPEEIGNIWTTRYIDDKKVFSFQPDNLYSNLDYDHCFSQGNLLDCVQLTESKNILGIQAFLYTELLRDITSIHSHLFPRLLPFAERAWHKAEWEDKLSSKTNQLKKDDWESFANRVGYKELRRLTELNINYHVPLPGVRTKNTKMKVCATYPGFIFLRQILNDETTSKWIKCKSSGFSADRKLEYLFVTVEANGNRKSRSIKLLPSQMNI